MIKTIAIILIIILLFSGLLFSTKNTIIFIKEVSIKTIDLVQTIYEKGKPIIQDITEKVNNTEQDIQS